MKKFILLLLVGYLIQSCCIEKKQSNPYSYFDVSIGKTVIVWPGHEISYVDPVGAQVGFETKVMELNENSSINSGLNISFQGSKYEDPESSGSVNLAYLNLPILYCHEFGHGFYGETGLQPGLLIGAKDKYNGESYDYKDQVKKFELGLPVGAGYNFKNGFGLGARATYGLTNLNNSEYEEGKLHNLMVVAVFRYKFNWSMLGKLK